MSRRPDRVEDPHLPAQGATDHTDRGHNGASVRVVRNVGATGVGCVRKTVYFKGKNEMEPHEVAAKPIIMV